MRPTLSAVAFFLVSLVAKGQSAPSSETRSTTSATEQAIVKEITPAELATMLASRKIFVYDCNEEDMFAEAHVPGAVLTVPI